MINRFQYQDNQPADDSSDGGVDPTLRRPKAEPAKIVGSRAATEGEGYLIDSPYLQSTDRAYPGNTTFPRNRPVPPGGSRELYPDGRRGVEEGPDVNPMPSREESHNRPVEAEYPEELDPYDDELYYPNQPDPETRNRAVSGSVDEQRVITTKFDPRDTNRDGQVDEIERYTAFMKMSPAERRATWVDEELHPKGLSVDEETNEIIDPQGNVVGQLPSFE